MMYEALLFDMNALGDIPDKDFTGRTSCAGSIPHEERGRDRDIGKHTHWGGRTDFHNTGSTSHSFSQPPGTRVEPHRSQHEIRVLVPNPNPATHRQDSD